MNTNTNSTPELPDFAGDLSGAAQALAAGFPDPAALARLANDFFRDLAVENTPPKAVLPATDVPVSSLTLPVAGVVVPDAGLSPAHVSNAGQPGPFNQPGFREATNVVSGQGLPGGVALPVHLASPGIPGGFSAAHISATPSFSFLEEARSLFSTAAGTTGPPIPATAKIPTETELREVQTNIPGSTVASVPALPGAAVAAPQVPGAVSRSGDMGLPGEYRLPEVRSLAPTEVAPVLAPVGQEPSFLKDADLSSTYFDVKAIRRDFPILQERVNGKPLIWLDNAATTQKPRQVIDRLTYFYEHENSNVHRAAHTLAARSTDAYDAARDKVRRFLNAATSREIIFVRGATEGVNLVANTWGKQHIREGDEIVVTHLEHHANIVPWQMLAAEKGARIRVAPVDNHGQILLDEYQKLFNSRTKIAALAHVSNALGTITPVQEMVEIAHRYGAKALVDGAQAVSHMRVDVQAINADFYVFSGHKLFAPTGIGVVYGKLDILENMQPWQGGGNMIADVTFEKTLYQPAPFRFEAGTGSIADAVGLGAAIDYLERLGMHNIGRYEHDLLVYATDGLQRIPGLHFIGTAREKASVLSFVLDGFTNDQVGQYLNQEGIAVRTGHHCAQPILRRFGLESTVRPSLAFYNTCEEIDALVAAVWNLKNGRAVGVV